MLNKNYDDCLSIGQTTITIPIVAEI